MMAPYPVKKRRLSPTNGYKSSDNGSALSGETSHEDGQFWTGEQIDDRAPRRKLQSSERSTQENRSSRMPLQYSPAEQGSSMLKLQVHEFSTELQRDYERRTAEIDHALRKLKDIIDRIPDQDAIPLWEAENTLRTKFGTCIPFAKPRPRKDTKYSFAYAKPTDINVVGSYARKTSLLQENGTTVDLAVTVPSKIYHDKDYLNYRYFHKRAFYLAYMAARIQSTQGAGFSISYAYQNENPLQPVILAKFIPEETLGFNIEIRVILGALENLFPIAKTLPAKNCVRMYTAEIVGGSTEPATPFYNATLRSECCIHSYLKLFNATSTQLEGFGDACRLGSVWLRQRGIGTGLASGGFGQFEWASILALLLRGGGPNDKPVLSMAYSNLQLFKAMIRFIASTDLLRTPVAIGGTSIELSDYRGPALYDGQRGINILFKMTKLSYRTLRYEAQITLQTLTTPLADQFRSTFVSKVDLAFQRFDSIVTLGIPNGWTPSRGQDATDRLQDFYRVFGELLSNGLGDRVNLICPSSAYQNTWSTDIATPSTDRARAISFGLLLNPDQSFRTVDKGPSTERKEEAAAYRQFWGKKAELRRFQDGSILETLIWAQDSEQSVAEQIIRYIVQYHLGHEAMHSLDIRQNMLDGYISDPEPPIVAPPIFSAFETLEKDIRAMEGLPLQIRHISPAGAELRYASLAGSPKRPLTQRISSMPPVDVCVQFEGSTRWPHDLVAVQRTKIAFLLKVGELLETNIEGLTARIAQENEKYKLLNSSFLDVIYSNGAAFRMRIHHEHELVMLNNALKDKTQDAGGRENIAQAVAAYKRTFVQAAAHTQAVRKLCTRHPLISPSMRLMKKWRDSHLLSSYVSDELIEILTIRTFVSPYPYQAPGSLTTAFFRTLSFIAIWDWHNDPLIVDLSGAMTLRDIDAIKLRFEGWRKIDPAMNRIAMFVASNIDPEGVTWTEMNPSKVVAARFTGLARAAYDLAKKQGMNVQAEALFTPAIFEFDFIIYLDAGSAKWSERSKKKTAGFKNLELERPRDTRFLDYNPINIYLEELRSLYGNQVMFFYGNESSKIAGLWNPQAGPRLWKINTAYSTLPLIQDGEEMISINKSSTLNDIVRLGADMVIKVETR